MPWFAMSFRMRNGDNNSCSMEFDNIEQAYDCVMTAIEKGQCIATISPVNTMVLNGKDISSVLITPPKGISK